MTIFDVVWAVSVLLLRGHVLHVSDVTVTSGTVARGRAVLIRNASAFDAALAFVELVGVKAALKSARVRAHLPKRGVVQWL